MTETIKAQYDTGVSVRALNGMNLFMREYRVPCGAYEVDILNAVAADMKANLPEHVMIYGWNTEIDFDDEAYRLVTVTFSG